MTPNFRLRTLDGRGDRVGRLDARLGPDHLVAAGADADEADRHADEVGDVVQVLAGCLWEVGLGPALRDVLSPALELLIDRRDAVQHRLVIREALELGALRAAVLRADAEALLAGQDVELRDDELRQAVDARGVAQRDEVDPAGAPRTPGRRPELAALRPQLLAELVVELGREGAGADACGVGLGHAPDLVDVLGPDAGADARRARHGVRARHERIRAVVDVEHRGLRALEDDRAVRVEQ